MNIGDKVVIKTNIGLVHGEILELLRSGQVKVGLKPVLKGNRNYYPKGTERDFGRSWIHWVVVDPSQIMPLVLQRDSNTQVTILTKG